MSLPYKRRMLIGTGGLRLLFMVYRKEPCLKTLRYWSIDTCRQSRNEGGKLSLSCSLLKERLLFNKYRYPDGHNETSKVQYHPTLPYTSWNFTLANMFKMSAVMYVSRAGGGISWSRHLRGSITRMNYVYTNCRKLLYSNVLLLLSLFSE